MDREGRIVFAHVADDALDRPDPRDVLNAWKNAVAAPPAPSALADLPVTMTVEQRSTTVVRGSHGSLRLTVGDVTRGKVEASLAGTDAGVVLAPISMREGDAVTFRYGGGALYVLRLSGLENSVFGQDFATFVLEWPGRAASAPSEKPAPASKETLTEKQKIERLIEGIERTEGAVFLRHDAELSPKQAAEHLRSKWQLRERTIASAARFIEAIATRSSLSGEPYRIRLKSGESVLSGDFLRERLAEIERGR